MLIKRLSLSKIGDLLKDRLGEEAEDYVFPEDFEKAVVDIDFKAIVLEGDSRPYDAIVVGNAVSDLRVFYENNQTGNTIKSITFVGGNQTKFAPSLFYGCASLTEIDVPDSLIEIGTSCFQYTALQSMDVSNVTTIGQTVFSNCPVSYVLLNPYASIQQGAFQNASNLTTCGIEGGGYDVELADNGCKKMPYLRQCNFTSVVIPNGYTEINTMSSSANLQSITIPDSVVTATTNSSLFDSCTRLQSFSANNLSFQGNSTAIFNNCTALQTVYLPKTTSYGNTFFKGCVALTSVQLGSVGYPVTNITSTVFQGCTGTSTVVTVYTTEAYVSTLLTAIRAGLTKGTIVIKAATDMEYNGSSYQAGDTVVTSTV